MYFKGQGDVSGRIGRETGNIANKFEYTLSEGEKMPDRSSGQNCHTIECKLRLANGGRINR